MNPIGGYFELELNQGRNNIHEGALRFKSGRSSLHYILQLLQPSLVYVPFYTCNALLEPFQAAGVPFRFYGIDENLDPVSVPTLGEKEYFLYINYFDLKRETVTRLSEQLGDRFIADCTQAFFMKGNGNSWFFNSCRKYFGVPDGSFLYAPASAKVHPPLQKNENYTIGHLLLRFNSHAREGYHTFQINEGLCDSEILGMSQLTEHLLSKIDYEQVIRARRSNFLYLKDNIERSMLELDEASVPMCYPYLFQTKPNRSYLHQHDIFIPSLWNDVVDRVAEGFNLERSISEGLLPLPVDHRYDTKDMNRIINILKEI